MPDADEHADGWERRRQTILIAVALLGLVAIAGLFVALWFNRFDAVATMFVLQNWRAIIGIPFSCFGAFVVVALFRQGSSTPIEFEGIGFKFKGSSGEVVLWCLCFIILASSLKLLSGPDRPVTAYMPQVDIGAAEAANDAASKDNVGNFSK